jgi:GT2 family glycosyltransferase
MAPSFSVVIPSFNAGPYLRPAIESALAQTTPPMEIIVIDDGSTDGTIEVARSFGPPVKVHCQSNHGQGAARNVGMSLAQGDWIALLDHDDLWDPDKLEAQAEAIRANPDAVVVYTDSRSLEGDRIVEILTAPDPDRLPKVLQRQSPLTPASVVFRKDIVIAEGGFSEVRGMLEDWDLWLRLIGRHRFVRIPRVLTTYRKSPKQVTQQPEKFLRVHMMCVDGTLLKGVKPPMRWIRRARLHSCFLADGAIMLREQGSASDLRWMLRSLAQWPVPTTWKDRRYKVLAHMLWKHAASLLGSVRYRPARPGG